MNNNFFESLFNQLPKIPKNGIKKTENFSAFDIYEIIKMYRNENVSNDLALDACIIAERIMNENNTY